MGNEFDMWEKIMKEVRLGRHSGPYSRQNIPFKNYIQSPIALVPKSGGKTRLIFHLSYDFGTAKGSSVNANTPKELCTVKYKDLDFAIKGCLRLLKQLQETGILYFGKSDLVSAFRILPIRPDQRYLLLLKARHPLTKEEQFFVDKCLPFGSSISCAHFQLFSDALAAILEHKMKTRVTNYLDDFLFMSESREQTNNLVRQFLNICQKINCPVSPDKIEWATDKIVFLGILLDGKNKILAVPQEKRIKTINLLKFMINSKKIKIKLIQKVAGLLNFLHRAIVPGRTFTRSMYDRLKLKDSKGKLLRPYHHIRVDGQFKKDCQTWLHFLNYSGDGLANICRPFVDLDSVVDAKNLDFASDASKAKTLGFGAVFGNRWIWGQWNSEFITTQDPSIEFLELFALTAAVVTWGHMLQNIRIQVYCDNEAVVHMVNNMTSKCPKCMKLIRILVLNSLFHNRRVFVRHISTKLNERPDALSRLQFERFWRCSPTTTHTTPDAIHHSMWPVENIWFDDN